MTEDTGISAVSETLFLPLYALALESRRPNPVMVDDGAVQLTQRLNETFASSDTRLFRRLAKGRLPHGLLTTVSLRIRQYDRFVADFLEREPDGIVVNMGCGLDDRRRRVDNGRVRWYDLDLPEVIELRRRFLSESERMHFIASSVLDHAWLSQLPDEPGHRFLFLAEGLFMYLPADGVRALVVALRERFPGAELIAEFANSKIVKTMQSPWGRGKFKRQFSLSDDVVYQFGLNESQELETWAPGIEFLGNWTYFDEDEPKLGWYRWFAGVSLFRWAQWTARFRLGGEQVDERTSRPGDAAVEVARRLAGGEVGSR